MKKDRVSRGLAIGYIFLGLYYWQGHATLNAQTIASFSITALAFVLSDACKAYSEKFSKEHNIYKTLQGFASFLVAVAIVVAIVGPNWNFSKREFMDAEYFNILSTTASLIGLGFSLYIIAKRNEKQEE